MRIDLPEVTLEALTWGPDDGPLAVLLHGFPDTAHTWRHLGPHLGDLGWRVVAPHLRGYAPSGLPDDDSYHVGAIMADAVGIHELMHSTAQPSVLIGHDWGAIAANALAGHEDCPFDKVVTLAVPPLGALQDFDARLLLKQMPNSWYILFNQLPFLPERTHERLVRKLWRDWSPGYDAREDIEHVLAAMRTPGHGSAPFDFYRALVRFWTVPATYKSWQDALMSMPVRPLLYVHGADDGCMEAGYVAKAAGALGDRAETHVVADAGHFLHVEQPEVVNQMIAAFIGPADRIEIEETP